MVTVNPLSPVAGAKRFLRLSISRDTITATGGAFASVMPENLTDTVHEEDEAIWQTKFENTPVDRIDRLIASVQEQIRAGRVRPLEFPDR